MFLIYVILSMALPDADLSMVTHCPVGGTSGRRAPSLPHGLAIAERSTRQVLPPRNWQVSAAQSECSLHQLAPYIGKLKSTIARDLVSSWSRPGDLIVDPFAGSGTIPLEAVISGRRVLASDLSPYSEALCRAKLGAPRTLEAATRDVEALLDLSGQLSRPDLRAVPAWVRSYFHPKTLKDILSFAEVCRREKNHFLLACLLGILHHQRPGFLSYPCSHLVPYLRDKAFPRSDYPHLYQYRELAPRLLAKLHRAMRRYRPATAEGTFVRAPLQAMQLPDFDALITSPPYMNALDYGRDNRLRLWLVDPGSVATLDRDSCSSQAAFVSLMELLADVVARQLRRHGYCILVTGQSVQRNQLAHPGRVVTAIFQQRAPGLRLERTIVDTIPDVRRSRRNCAAVKTEEILVFRKVR